MKILFLLTGLRLGGAERQLLLLCKHLKMRGFDVAVTAMESGGIMKQEFLNEGITVFELDIINLRSLIGGYRRFSKIVKQFQPSVIHAHMIHANYFSAIFKLFNPKHRLIITAHNLIEGNKMLMHGYRIIKSIPNWATQVSAETYHAFIDNRYFLPKRSSHIENAIDTALFNPKHFNQYKIRTAMGISLDDFVFLGAGRLQHQKNFELLIKAFKKSKAANSVLLIAGEGVLEKELKQLCVELQLANAVRFLGRKTDMASLFALSDCFVLSSNFEGFGLVAAEAMAMQKPVIATDCGGVSEVLGGLGTLVPVNDLEALAAAMQNASYARQESGLEELRIHIEKNYSIEKVLKKWEHLYFSL